MKQQILHKRIRQILTILVFIFLVEVSEAFEEWTQWRGSNRDGIVRTLPRTWPKELTKQWEVEIGAGHSTPVVMNGHVFTFTREGEDEVVRSINLVTGKIEWRSSYPAPYRVYPGAAGHGTGPRSTPAVSQHGLFTFGISGILSAFDLRSGKIKWQKQFGERFSEPVPPFGVSMSPAIAGDLVIVHAGGHQGGALIAIDQETGAERWTLPGEGPSYSSPIIVNLNGVIQIVLQAHRKAMGVHLLSGKLLWSIPFVTPCDQNIVTPVLAGDLLVFSSLDTGTYAIRLRNEAGTWSTEKVWETRAISMYMSSPVYVDGIIFGMSHRKQGQFFAIDAKSGSILWSSAGQMAENAAFVGNKESILILKDDGELKILSTSGNNPGEVRNYRVANSSTWAHPVPVESGLLIKDTTSLIRWDYADVGKADTGHF